MTLTKKLQQKILEVHNSYWDHYLKGQVNKMIPLLDENYTQVGSAETEVFSNKKDAVRFLRDTIHQVAGNLEMCNRNTQLEAQGDTVLIHELCDVYVKTGNKWVFYAKFRATTLMQDKNGNWKIIHQHSSFPDARTGEGENIAIDKIAAENDQLREAIKRRTIELESKNRDLEIETALEKVRTIAMSMRTPSDMLQICKEIATQLALLGVHEIRNVQTAIFYPERTSYMNYEYYTRHDKTCTTDTLYSDHTIARAFAKKMMQGKGKMYVTHIKGPKVKEWIKYQKTTNVFIDSYLNKASSLNYYWYSLGPVALGTSTYVPLNKVDQDLFKRFLNVFELSYTRYLDIEKAEAQAREAKIEAALERVRGKALAMHTSKELKTVAKEMRQQFSVLGLKELETCAIHLWDETYTTLESWAALRSPDNLGELIESEWKHAIKGIRILEESLQKYRSGQKDYILINNVSKAKEFFSLIKKLDPKVSTFLSKVLKNKKTKDITGYWSFADFSGGSLVMVTMKPPSEDTRKLLRRFTNVFEQAFIRFQDLQKAEAQARESQIEAALERVRASSMAMHKSEELLKVIKVVATQLKSLEIKYDAVNFIKVNKDKSWEQWVATLDMVYPHQIHLPYIDHPLFNMLHEELKKDIVFLIGAKDKNKLIRHFFDHIAGVQVPKERMQHLFQRKGMAGSTFRASSLFLSVYNYDALPYTHAENEIFRRFAIVFDQTYTRFLDLQKAEKQAREAQIETALERVRAASMAMHSSKDLFPVIQKLTEQLADLNIHFESASFLKSYMHPNLNLWISTKGQPYPADIYLPYFKHPIVDAYTNPDTSAIEQLNQIISKKEKDAFFKVFFGLESLKNIPSERVKYVMDREGYCSSAFKVRDIWLTITKYKLSPFTDEENQIFRRFAKVFEQSYTRFLDLQKAEAQAREAQIEAALERVRASSMAMHKSEELLKVITVVATQLNSLEIKYDAVNFIKVNKDKSWEQWVATLGMVYPYQIHLPYIDHPLFIKLHEELKKDIVFFTTILGVKDKNKLVRHFFEHIAGVQVPKERKQYLLQRKGMAGSTFRASSLFLSIYNYDALPYTHAENEIFRRFAIVFDQTYTRFLDLQKAEKQAREAQIEAALERVRSRSMAMHKSEELPETSHILFQQLKELGEPVEQLTIGIVHEENNVIEISATLHGETLKKIYQHSTDEPYMMNKIYKAWKSHQKTLVVELYGEALNAYNRYRNDLTNTEMFPTNLGDEYKRIVYAAFFSKGMLALGSNEARPPESLQLLERFASVFDLTYTRFLDLQKAEAQTKEAQIETALERVRSHSLAMHKSSDIQEVVAVVFTQLQQLGINFEVIGIGTRIENTNDILLWIGNDQNAYANRVLLPRMDVGPGRDVFIEMDNQSIFFSKIYTFEEKNHFWNYAFENSGFRQLPDMRKKYILESPSFSLSAAPIKNILILLIDYTGKVASEHEAEVIKRFARVFEQCYVRFQDLERAEAQAKEATIQASLERVRSKAMAMHSSKDLDETIHTFYTELSALNLTPRRCGLGLVDPKTRIVELSTMNTSKDGISVEAIGSFELSGHWVWEGIYDHFIQQQEFHPVLRGNEIKEYNQLIRKHIAFPDYPEDAVQYGYFFFFENGGIYAWTDKELQEDELTIYRRFTSVLSLTYRRYKDLKDAESRALEAVKQAALDRVRAEIASMRTIQDLDRITPLIWRELTTLGIPFVRCGVFIMDDEAQIIHTYLSTPDGKAIAAFHLSYDSTSNLADAINGWRTHRQYITHWLDKDFQSQADTLVQQGAIATRDQYLSTIPKEGIYLHFLPFLQGMLYVGHTAELSKDDLHLIQSVADAFSTAYARYEDFTKMEAAKKQVDTALNELKATQKQLVQSEKMASLGELTAGIAHEIQNPLNFVNNFSEVSTELIKELIDEVEKGNTQEAKSIADDLIGNLEKINNHGARAASIVKGMLQHSRSSTGVKEPTDINALCEEYMRLAYQSMRSKDKDFQCDYTLDLDPNMPKINVVAQDISRVILNIVNNAFQACQEKNLLGLNRGNHDVSLVGLPQNQEEYKPVVLLATKFSPNGTGASLRLPTGQAGLCEICISDNGPGIPDSIKDKIFQPFFTTKPTGQGTGLGLSLAYDIVKAHGGDLKVDTNIGEGPSAKIVGSRFIIKLPID